MIVLAVGRRSAVNIACAAAMPSSLSVLTSRISVAWLVWSDHSAKAQQSRSSSTKLMQLGPQRRAWSGRGRTIVGGRSNATPFVSFARVNLVLLALTALIAVIVLLVLWPS